MRQSQRKSLARLWRPSTGPTGTGLAVLVVREISPTPSQMFLQTLLLIESTPSCSDEHMAAFVPALLLL